MPTLNDEIEALDKNIHDLSPTEIDRVVAAFSSEGLELRRKRKDVRYQLYRLRTAHEGKCAHASTDEFKAIFEEQQNFDSWRMFGTTWDVAFDDPYRIVHKELSEQEEWEELIRAKFPVVEPGGKISYPDINVRKKVEAEGKRQAKKKASKKKRPKKKG